MNIIKWKVATAPTGRYRSFERRSWPLGTFKNGEPAIMLSCTDAYVPAQAREGRHAELKVYIAWREASHTSFTWKALKRRATTLSEAKDLAEKWYAANPEQVALAERGGAK